MAAGVLGLEGDIAYAPHFFGEKSERGDNYVLTTMANVLVGIPLGPVRPYAVGGLGLIHTDISQSPVGAYQALSNNSFAMNVGGGLLAMFARHVGVRGDLRYLRTLQSLDLPLQLQQQHLEFWRGSVGLALRF
jgi:opacity protein-like surface antigen